jgi:hypothetical protein
MGKFTNNGWQNSASNAPQPIGIVTGANLNPAVSQPLSSKDLKMGRMTAREAMQRVRKLERILREGKMAAQK